MPRSRVLSFMSQWGGPRSPTEKSSHPAEHSTPTAPSREKLHDGDTAPQSPLQKLDASVKAAMNSSQTTLSRARADSRVRTRPSSMLHTYQPPQVEVAPDTPPELQPIFTYLNSHGNKLYQEGYFLKLHDLDSRGRPSQDRTWVECFAQLIGTVLSLWDAAALDVAGEDGEVVPTFVNLSDASIKMIESLPMSSGEGGALQNVLSISTAANNRYLLHFNSLNSLTQWTAGIRLAMFEHSTLQEGYTGSLIAGKGRVLNNIKQIMERTRFAHEDWARVRFGAGTPWRRCWCVISPPDEKEFSKAQKTIRKSSAYERIRLPKGDIKFYDTRKITKKTRPIATITDAYAAYAIYPQSKPLIDQSTLVKLEGLVTMHTSPETVTEGFVFVMPEVHPAVTGFEMMLRWLFPVFDTFGLYGRPTRLIADTLDQRGLMFAMPRERHYGYLDILDVSGLIHTKGSQAWSERQWRREMKKLTSHRLNSQLENASPDRMAFAHRRSTTSRTSFTSSRGNVRFGDGAPIHSSPGSRSASPVHTSAEPPPGPVRTDSAPPGQLFSSPHKRSVSDAHGYRRHATETSSRLSYESSRLAEDDFPPEPPRHGGALGASLSRPQARGTLERIQSQPEVPTTRSAASSLLLPPGPVGTPPAMTHQANSRPATQPYQAPELRRAHSNVDAATLYQMQDAARSSRDGREAGDHTWEAELPHRQHTTVASTTPINGNNLDAPADSTQGVVNRKQRDSRQRLSTIPGSPYVGTEVDSSQSPAQMSVSKMDGVVEESGRSVEVHPASVQTQMAPAAPLRPSHSIARKPLPKPESLSRSAGTSAPADVESPVSPVLMEEWAGGVIDEEALDRVLQQQDRSNTIKTESTEPDYASTISASTKEEEEKKKKKKNSIEKPRAGKLKTVGDPDMPATDARSGGAGRLDTWQADRAAEAAEIPDVNFGPTYAYKPDGRPSTSGTLTPSGMLGGNDKRSRSADERLRSRSRDRLSAAFGESARTTPEENKRNSYFGRTNTPSPSNLNPSGMSPGGRVTPSGVDGQSKRHSIAWQPAVTPQGDDLRARNSMSPEQWVQMRASMAQQTPQYALPRKPIPNFAHERNMSSSSVNQLRKLTKTPPLGRAVSADWTQQIKDRTTPPSRPHSRGASMALESAAGATLSAKEQMQVSRATGAPLINLASHDAAAKQQDLPSPGLVGYVGAREREKASNRNSMAVHQAIVERQQQQQQQLQMRMEAEAQAQAQAEAQAQAQAQAQSQYYQQQHQQNLLQQMSWNKMALAQNQAPIYGPQRPGLQTRNSWNYGGQPQMHQQGYAFPGQQGQYGPPDRSYSMQHQPQQYGGQGQAPYQGQQQHQHQYQHSQSTAPRGYGASFYNSHQGQQRR